MNLKLTDNDQPDINYHNYRFWLDERRALCWDDTGESVSVTPPQSDGENFTFLDLVETVGDRLGFNVGPKDIYSVRYTDKGQLIANVRVRNRVFLPKVLKALTDSPVLISLRPYPQFSLMTSGEIWKVEPYLNAIQDYFGRVFYTMTPMESESGDHHKIKFIPGRPSTL